MPKGVDSKQEKRRKQDKIFKDNLIKIGSAMLGPAAYALRKGMKNKKRKVKPTARLRRAKNTTRRK